MGVLNVPNLRFPEFIEEWDQKSISDVANVVGGGTPDTTIAEYWDGNIQWFTPSEIGKSKYISKSERKITQSGLNNSSAKILPQGTILLSTRATIGECSIAMEECSTNQGFQSLISKSNYNSEFVYYLIQTKKKDLIRNACGSTFLEISANEVRKIKCRVPQINEQDKITQLLSLIDKRIATQNKIIEQLQSLIKGIVVEHYNKSHKTKFKIKDLGRYYSVMNMSKEDLSETGNECIIYGELFTTYDCVATNIVSKTEKAIQSSTVSTGYDLLFPASTTVDAQSLIAPTAISQPSIILGGDMFGIVVNKKYNNEYLSYIFNYIYKNYLARYAQGSTIIHLYYNDIKNLNIELPDINTQNELVLLLQNMQDKILTEKKMLSILETQKAYLFKNLFI